MAGVRLGDREIFQAACLRDDEVVQAPEELRIESMLDGIGFRPFLHQPHSIRLHHRDAVFTLKMSDPHAVLDPTPYGLAQGGVEEVQFRTQAGQARRFGLPHALSPLDIDVELPITEHNETP